MLQIEYIMVGSKDKRRLQNVDTEDEMYIGHDHRTVTATLKIRRRQPKNKKDGKRKETRTNLKSWEPKNKDHYASALDKAITTECYNNQEWAKQSKSEKVYLLDKILIQTAVQHTKPTKKDEAKVTVPDQNLRTAIAGRKHFRANKQYKEAAQMAKYVKKLQRRTVNTASSKKSTT